jgi:hypothetical protein
MTNFRTCIVCGVVCGAVLANGALVDVCERHGATACPMARVEMLHIHSEGPQGPRLDYVSGTGTGGPTGPGYVLNAEPVSFKLVGGSASFIVS